MSEEINKIFGQLRENQESLKIARVPIETKRKFTELADKEFCGDYGMLLKALMDGLIDKDMAVLLHALSRLEQRVMFLESRIISGKEENKEEKKKVIKTLDGREIRTGGEKNVKTERINEQE